MNFSIKRFVANEKDSTLKAFCDVTVNEAFVIRGIRVVEGRSGPFVSLPRQLSSAGKWYDSVVPINRMTRNNLQRVVLEAYFAHCNRTKKQVGGKVNQWQSGIQSKERSDGHG